MNHGKDRFDRADRKESQACRADRADGVVRKYRRRAGADVSLAPARNRNVLHFRNCLPRILLRPRMAMVDERVSIM